MDPLTDLLLKQENLYLMAAVWVLLETLQRALPENVTSHSVWVRLQPVMPVILCLGGVWLPYVMARNAPISQHVMVGLILGYAVGHSRKIVLQGVLGQDARIPHGQAVPPPAPPQPKDQRGVP
jgi:hypothetical protein